MDLVASLSSQPCQLPKLCTVSPSTVTLATQSIISLDSRVYGLDGIMQTYNFALRNVSFDGPTYFNPII